jgi:hypothetical protein
VFDASRLGEPPELLLIFQAGRAARSPALGRLGRRSFMAAM